MRLNHLYSMKGEWEKGYDVAETAITMVHVFARIE